MAPLSRLARLGALALLTTPSLALPAADPADADAPPTATITTAPDPNLAARALDPTGAWVSVDDEGRPAATLTPFMTTDREGTSYLRDAAPHDLTATLYTFTNYGKVSTSTGEPPNPTATNKNKEGGFPVCQNMDGDHAPICAPTPSSTLFQDSIYYITWDPEYYNQTDSNIPANSTVEISLRLDYFNRTKENSDEGDVIKLDETDRVPASWGLFALNIDKSYLKGFRPHNVTISLMSNIQGSADKNRSATVNVLVDYHHRPAPELSKGPSRNDLVIALPVVFGTIVLLAVGVCLWNRKTRRIQLGNVMSRSRKGYTGRSARRMFHRSGSSRTDQDIHLEPRKPVFEYSDTVAPGDSRPRRDSDLGSLAGSPVSPNFGPQNPTGGGSNAFRDEMRRQDEQRRNERDMH